jgi:ribonuclease HI
MSLRGGGITEAPPLVAVYADESCLGNGREGTNPGGAGGLIEYMRPDARLSRWDYWVSEPATTNNRMALRSAIEALRILSRKGNRLRVVFTSDSQYLVKGFSEWVHGWIARGWRRKEGAIENLDLWREAVEVARSHLISWQWVRGHQGHAQNEYANHLAVRAARADEVRGPRRVGISRLAFSRIGARPQPRRAGGVPQRGGLPGGQSPAGNDAGRRVNGREHESHSGPGHVFSRTQPSLTSPSRLS